MNCPNCGNELHHAVFDWDEKGGESEYSDTCSVCAFTAEYSYGKFTFENFTNIDATENFLSKASQ